ncbi:MAG: O-acetyl-ADP-ribose deacetylase [Candidatus Omnitrophica bacterium]|nr:O-acetyl-ADP-ribose deacetylase [Candidatus Omnitrophota bacterium]
MDTKIEVKLGDITKENVDAIVNAANTSLLGGGGVDGAIHRAAGAGLLAECTILHGCKTGEAKLTKGYKLPSKFVIHTVGPVWHGGNRNEDDLLANCYRHSLMIAQEYQINSIAFPSISTGVYRFPIPRAAQIAVKTVKENLAGADIKKIIFVCFDELNYKIYYDLLNKS